MPSSIDWATEPVEHPLDGIARQTVHAAHQTLVRYIYQPGSIFPVHSHPEEQITIVLRGAIDFVVDGVPLTLHSGGVAIIPPFVPHGASVSGAEAVETLNTMSPRRAAAPKIENANEGKR